MTERCEFAMARALRPKRKTESVSVGAEITCPVCLEHTENDRFCFPCGHAICRACDSRMLANDFLACPTCRQPREGVSQSQVESANNARVSRHAAQDEQAGQAGHQTIVLRAGGREVQVLFFPDESRGANPFASLIQTHSQNATDNDHLHAQVVDAADAVRSAFPHLNTSSGPRLGLHGSMRELVDRLLRPGTVGDFLAQREVVRAEGGRGGGRRTRRRGL